MKISEILALRVQAADLLSRTDENPAFDPPSTLMFGVRPPAGQVPAVEQRDKALRKGIGKSSKQRRGRNGLRPGSACGFALRESTSPLVGRGNRSLQLRALDCNLRWNRDSIIFEKCVLGFYEREIGRVFNRPGLSANCGEFGGSLLLRQRGVFQNQDGVGNCGVHDLVLSRDPLAHRRDKPLQVDPLFGDDHRIDLAICQGNRLAGLLHRRFERANLGRFVVDAAIEQARNAIKRVGACSLAGHNRLEEGDQFGIVRERACDIRIRRDRIGPLCNGLLCHRRICVGLR